MTQADSRVPHSAKPRALLALRAALIAAATLLAPPLAGLSAPAQAETQRAATSGAELVTMSGLDEVFATLGETMRNQIEAMGLPRAQLAPFLEALEVFDGEAMNAQVARRFDALLTQEERELVADFYGSPLGERMVALERRATRELAAPDAMEKLAGVAETYQAASDRAEIYEDMIESLRLDELQVFMMRSMVSAMMQGMFSLQSDAPRPDQSELDALVESQVEAMGDALAQQNRLSLAYTYREAEIDDLRAHLAFLQSEPGERFYAATLAALTETLDDAMFAFGRRLTELTRNKDL